MKGKIAEDLRRTDDIETLLISGRYSLGRYILELLSPMHLVLNPLGKTFDRIHASLKMRAGSIIRSLSRTGKKNIS